MSQTQTEEKTQASAWKRFLFSDMLADKSAAKKIAYIAVLAALCIVTNTFEIKFATVQFSFTIVSSVLAGMMIGPLFGAAAVFLGDGIGYLMNSMGYPYYWWVALSCAMMAVIAGLIMHIPMRFKGSIYVKLVLICVSTLFICSVIINSTGMYYIGLKIYMPKNVLAAFEERFGGRQTFGIYLLIRFFILGQIWNSVVNYALLFAIVPVLKAIKPLKLRLE
ncbi:MAG: ECF transporter S component [Clostridia bacterium]|nr:ECF transporter S component [Clostridia bacterium]